MKLHLLRDAIFNRNAAFSAWFVKYRWWIIGTMGFILLALEIAELIVRGANLVDTSEIFIYVALTGIISGLIEMLLRSLAVQKHTAKILDAGYKLSLKLISHESWDVLAIQLARFPCEIAPIKNVRLYVRNSISNHFELAAIWNEEKGSSGEQQGNHDFYVCGGCLKRQTKDEFLTQACSDDGSSKEYCFQINYGYQLIAILKLSLASGVQFTKDQKDILWNVREGMAIALQSGLDRKRLSELQLAQAALSERRTVSHYLHDNLSQNLGYIRLKLDQWLNCGVQVPLDLRPDLERMLTAAEQSYELVRGKLEILQPETTPLLTNLLVEHANKVAGRANLNVNFETRGEPVALAPEVQRAVFYAFQEALGNAEKHARACRVDVLIIWSMGSLNVLVQDDGQGFDPGQIQVAKHFGLQIMLERIASVNGWIEFNSSASAGTTVSISVPLPVAVEKGVDV